MSVRVWSNVALTAALVVWGLSAHAQATSVAGGQGAVPQVRPAPVTGRVATDPAAVALRPAAQAPATSTARQVPPPANLNEPLLKPEAEQVKTASSSVRSEPRASVSAQEPTKSATSSPRPHVDRTHGVKKSNETQPRPHGRKTKGKPHHAGQKASSVEPKDGRHPGGKGAKRGAALHDQHAAANAEGHGTRTPQKRAATQAATTGTRAAAPHVRQTGKQTHVKQAPVKQPGSVTKALHAHAAASTVAPLSKKPARHKRPHA